MKRSRQIPVLMGPATTSGIAGAVDNMVCVAASDQSDARASFLQLGQDHGGHRRAGNGDLSTYVDEGLLREDFVPRVSRTPGGPTQDWKRVDTDPPLSSFGITNDTPTQADGATRRVTTDPVTVTGPTTCNVTFFRKLTSSSGDMFCIRRIGERGRSQHRDRGQSERGAYSLAFDVPAGSAAGFCAVQLRKGRRVRPPPTGSGSTTSNSPATCRRARRTAPATHSCRAPRWRPRT